jgi:hypothetical protein
MSVNALVKFVSKLIYLVLYRWCCETPILLAKWVGRQYCFGLWQCLWRDRLAPQSYSIALWLAPKLCLLFCLGFTIDIKSLQNRLLKVCYVPATRVGLNRLLLLLQPLNSTNEANKASGMHHYAVFILRCLWLAHQCC